MHIFLHVSRKTLASNSYLALFPSCFAEQGTDNYFSLSLKFYLEINSFLECLLNHEYFGSLAIK